MTTGHAFRNALGAAVAEIKATVEADSFLENADRLNNISPAQKDLLETLGAAFAAANFFAGGEDIASDFEVTFRITRDIAQLSGSEKLHFNARNGTSFSVDVIPGEPNGNPVKTVAPDPGTVKAESASCCRLWVWDPNQKKLVCKASC